MYMADTIRWVRGKYCYSRKLMQDAIMTVHLWWNMTDKNTINILREGYKEKIIICNVNLKWKTCNQVRAIQKDWNCQISMRIFEIKKANSHACLKKKMPVFIIKLKSSSGYHNNNRPTLGPIKQNIVHPEPHDNTVPRSQDIPSMSGLDDWFDVFTSRFLFTLQVRSASMVCRSSGIQLLQ